MKTLLILSPQIRHVERAEQNRREAADESPRVSLFENTLNADVIDGSYLQSLSGIARILYKLLPAPVFQAVVAYRRRRRYDIVISWDDRFALIYALLLKLTHSRSRHVAILSWMVPLKKGFLLKLVHKDIDRMIVRSQTHRDLLIEFWGIPPAKIVEIPNYVDQQFWRPMDIATEEEICSVGDSKRDYATLIEAVRDLPIRCSIVTQVNSTHQGADDGGMTGKYLATVSDLPDNVTLGPASPAELRAIYARSRFVVVPLPPSFRDHGVTTIKEAMAMGKAVICSRIYGQIDFVDDGENGIFIPPGDPKALRDAIEYLLEHPHIAEQMGAKGRLRAEEIFPLDHFVANVQQILDDVITGNRTHIPTAAEKRHSPRVVAASRGEGSL